VLDLTGVPEHELHLLAALHLDAVGDEHHLRVVRLVHFHLDGPYDGLLCIPGLAGRERLVAMTGRARAGDGQGGGQRQGAHRARESGQAKHHHGLLSVAPQRVNGCRGRGN
jgi:hypothetical protein